MFFKDFDPSGDLILVFLIMGWFISLGGISTLRGLMRASNDLKDWDEKYFVYGTISVFEFTPKQEDDPVRDVISKLITLNPFAEDELRKHKADLTYDQDLPGKRERHRFDAILSRKHGRTLVRYCRGESAVNSNGLKMLRMELEDIVAADKVQVIRMVILSNTFSDDAVDFVSSEENQKCGKGTHIDWLLLRPAGEIYQIIWIEKPKLS
jgi:hypothetical protein